MIISKLRAPYAAAVAVGLFMTRTTLVGAGIDPGFVVPVEDESGWRLLSYRGRPTHQVRFDASGLNIEVAASAGPIIRVRTAAIWIATDGDDTRSAFTVFLEHLELEGGRP